LILPQRGLFAPNTLPLRRAGRQRNLNPLSINMKHVERQPIPEVLRPKRRLPLPAHGGCQCGECRYELSADPYVAYTCHCRACQKLTASAFLSCMQIPIEGFKPSRGTPESRSRTADSGNVLNTAFCGKCGSTLYIDNSARPRVRTVHIGSLDNPDHVEVTAHIWVKRKLPWVILPASHRIFEAAGNWTQDYLADPSRYSE